MKVTLFVFAWSAAGILVMDLRGSAAATSYPDAVLADNPIAYWRLNEVSQRPPDVATNTGSVGAAGNGIYSGAPLRQQPGALAGSADPAVIFDGLLQKLDVAHQEALNPAGPLTVELWVRPTGGQSTIRSPLSSRHLPSGRAFGYLFYTTLGNQWEFRTHNGTAANRVIGGIVQLNTWTHLVGVFDGVATRLYVNGVPVGYPVTNAYAANTVTPFRVGGGANEGSGAFFWPGSIDEVAIYSSALSPTRIASHYQTASNASPATPYAQVVLADAPVGYWRLNEPASAPLAVALNRGTLGALANGTFQSGASPGDAGPRPPQFIGFEADNRACAFDGTNGFVSTMSGLLNGRSAFTLSGWIKRAGPQGLRTALFGQNDVVEFGYVTDARLYVRDQLSATNVSATNSFPDGTWNHVSVVRSGINLVLYTNGVLAASAVASPASALSNAFGFNIGGAVFDPTGNFFRGSIDEVAVFDKALGFEQVSAHYFNAVAAPPRISGNLPASTNVYAGDTLALALSALGPAPLRFEWSLNASLLPGQTNAALVVNTVSPSAEGFYQCRVANDYGVTTSALCLVTVLAPRPPGIVSSPKPVTIYAGLTAAFGVAAIGPTLAYQWQMNQVNISGATNSSLQISNVQSAHAADYRVIVSNHLGTATSAVATLTVLVPAPGSFAAGVVSGRPLAYWRLGEPVGPIGFDYAGGHHATRIGQVAFGEAGPGPPQLGGFEIQNRACRFNGVDAFLTTSNGLLNARSNFTLMGWINRAGQQTESTGIWGQKDVVAFGFIDATTLEVWSPRGGQLSVAWPFALHEWHFVAVVGSGADLRLYLDGAMAGRNTFATATYGSSTAGFNIGGGGIFDELDTDFEGRVDEVAVFDRAVAAEEICRLYRAALQAPLRIRVERTADKSVSNSTGSVALMLWWSCGTLQQADELRGPFTEWIDVPEAFSPFAVGSGAGAKFYRIKESN